MGTMYFANFYARIIFSNLCFPFSEQGCYRGYSESRRCLWLQNCRRRAQSPAQTVCDRWKQGCVECRQPWCESWWCRIRGEWGLCGWHCYQHWRRQGNEIHLKKPRTCKNGVTRSTRHIWYGAIKLQPRMLDERQTTIYKRAVDKNYHLKMKSSRFIFSEINQKFPIMPFSARSASHSHNFHLYPPCLQSSNESTSLLPLPGCLKRSEPGSGWWSAWTTIFCSRTLFFTRSLVRNLCPNGEWSVWRLNARMNAFVGGCRGSGRPHQVHSPVDAERIGSSHLPPATGVAAQQDRRRRPWNQSLVGSRYQDEEEGRREEEEEYALLPTLAFFFLIPENMNNSALFLKIGRGSWYFLSNRKKNQHK